MICWLKDAGGKRREGVAGVTSGKRALVACKPLLCFLCAHLVKGSARNTRRRRATSNLQLFPGERGWSVESFDTFMSRRVEVPVWSFVVWLCFTLWYGYVSPCLSNQSPRERPLLSHAKAQFLAYMSFARGCQRATLARWAVSCSAHIYPLCQPHTSYRHHQDRARQNPPNTKVRKAPRPARQVLP